MRQRIPTTRNLYTDTSQPSKNMKGIVFREFSEMVEATFGDEMMDTLIRETDLESGGVYTTVGTYSHTELVALVVNLAERTNIPVQDLVQAFGKYLFGRFHSLFPGFFEHDDSFSFLDSIHDVVHVEVLKLYPSAMLPDFNSEIMDEGRTLLFEYHSHRHFADLAIGLMNGAFEFWDDHVEVTMEDKSEGDKQVILFTCRKVD